jgi:DNA invertase Pin-like site-specific DNA recombinase
VFKPGLSCQVAEQERRMISQRTKAGLERLALGVGVGIALAIIGYLLHWISS